MAPRQATKTYSKKTSKTKQKSVEAVNALFVENLTKRYKSRKKAKVKIKDLPQRTEPYLTDDSLKIEPNNTFDKLLQGTVYNPVKICSFVKINSSSEISKTSSFRSPILTRNRSKSKTKITEILEETPQLPTSLITNSLYIEKETQKADFSSLSYIRIPTENLEKSVDNSKVIFSSTPCSKAARKRVPDDTISPITSSKLVEKSYEKIREWDQKFPDSEIKQTRLSFDWKLNIQPKVYLENLLIIDSPAFRGFTETEQHTSREKCESFRKTIRRKSKSKRLTRRKSHKLIKIDLTDEVLSEKEISCISTTASSCSNLYQTDNLSEDVELELPQHVVVDLAIFDDFMSKHYSEDSIISISDVSCEEKSPMKQLEQVFHDHSYSIFSIAEENSRLSDVIESSLPEIQPKSERKSIKIKSGKSYRRSIALLKKTSLIVEGKPENSFRCGIRKSLIVPISQKSRGKSILATYARNSKLF